MCGITGAVGLKDISNVLFGGIRNLEYRGYDSCGVALMKLRVPHTPEHLDWLTGHLHEGAVLAVAGDSAGGNLAAALCVALRQQGRTQPRAQALISDESRTALVRAESAYAEASQRLVGEKHLKLELLHHGSKIDGIWFNHTDPLPARTTERTALVRPARTVAVPLRRPPPPPAGMQEPRKPAVAPQVAKEETAAPSPKRPPVASKKKIKKKVVVKKKG